jgi:hypothetical protein
MKLTILMEVDVSKTIAETMQRSGFTLALDGSAMQVKVHNCPPIPQRKTRVVFVQNGPSLTQLLADFKVRNAPAAPEVSSGEPAIT